MSLAERLEAARRPTASSMERILQQLTREDATALTTAATDANITDTAILRALRDEGFRVGKQTIADWRRANGLTR